MVGMPPSGVLCWVTCSKVGERAGMLFSRAEQIDMVITGKGANPEILQKLEDQGVKVLRV